MCQEKPLMRSIQEDSNRISEPPHLLQAPSTCLSSSSSISQTEPSNPPKEAHLGPCIRNGLVNRELCFRTQLPLHSDAHISLPTLHRIVMAGNRRDKAPCSGPSWTGMLANSTTVPPHMETQRMNCNKNHYSQCSCSDSTPSFYFFPSCSPRVFVLWD